jgi:ABC-type nickel/cobalt efflux system permease component RcnA
MDLVTATATGLVLGAAHGLGPDHCAALASLLSDGRDRGRRRAVGLALRFAAGHAVGLVGLAVLATCAGVLVAPAWERAAETAGGLLVVSLGAVLLWRGDLEPLLHRHPHGLHFHAHPGGHFHTHNRSPGPVPQDGAGQRAALTVGGALAVGGVRALTIALPPLLIAAHSWWAAVGFVTAFATGIAFSMVGFGLLFGTARARLARRPDAAGISFERAVGFAAVALGVVQIAQAW